MNKVKVSWLIIGLSVTIGIIIGGISWHSKKTTQLDFAEQAYIYAYPLVLMDITQKTMTHKGEYTNTFINIPEFPTDAFKHIVRPNVDTLYSFAWLDLRQNPLILSVPDTHDRYYLIEFLDAWTNVFETIGKRTTGTKAQQFIIIGPDFKGDIQQKFTKIQAPTNMVLLLARTQTYGKKDFQTVHAIQAGYTLASLSDTKKSLKKAPIFLGKHMSAEQNQEAPVDIVSGMDAATFYATFAHALKFNPPAVVDGPMLQLLKQMGIEPGKEFNPHNYSSDLMRILNRSMKKAFKEIATKKDSIQNSNGWGMMFDIGTYGINYLTRAMVAYIGIGANLPVDALYPTAFVDAQNMPLNGTNNYRIHFDKDQLPPANAFWSITLYNAQSFLVKNALNRYALNDKDPLQFNEDGSLDIYIQHKSPGADKENNWLPAPTDAFNLTMRLYWPKKEVLNGLWKPPVIEKVA